MLSRIVKMAFGEAQGIILPQLGLASSKSGVEPGTDQNLMVFRMVREIRSG